ncbi:MAG: hypothetical protein KIT27_01335 [Legionellales bacterium]|nr:hypothetical protein [Legionellales bacterium]
MNQTYDIFQKNFGLESDHANLIIPFLKQNTGVTLLHHFTEKIINAIQARNYEFLKMPTPANNHLITLDNNNGIINLTFHGLICNNNTPAFYFSQSYSINSKKKSICANETTLLTSQKIANQISQKYKNESYVGQILNSYNQYSASKQIALSVCYLLAIIVASVLDSFKFGSPHPKLAPQLLENEKHRRRPSFGGM